MGYPRQTPPAPGTTLELHHPGRRRTATLRHTAHCSRRLRSPLCRQTMASAFPLFRVRRLSSTCLSHWQSSEVVLTLTPRSEWKAPLACSATSSLVLEREVWAWRCESGSGEAT